MAQAPGWPVLCLSRDRLFSGDFNLRLFNLSSQIQSHLFVVAEQFLAQLVSSAERLIVHTQQVSFILAETACLQPCREARTAEGHGALCDRMRPGERAQPDWCLFTPVT